MSLKEIVGIGARNVIGTSMRAYRASPLYPRLGRTLGKVLGIVTRNASKIVIREIDGVPFELDLQEVIDASLFYSGTFEAEAERTITAMLKPGMTAVDIGANFGYHTHVEPRRRFARAVRLDRRATNRSTMIAVCLNDDDEEFWNHQCINAVIPPLMAH